MRDAQSMLDQLVAFCGNHIAEENVLEIFGFTSLEVIADLTDAILAKKSAVALEAIHAESEKGKDLSRLLADWIGYLRNLLIALVDPKNEFGDLAPEVAERLRAQTKLAVPERLLNLIDHFADTETRMKWAPNKRLHLEIAVIKAMQILAEMTISDVIGILHQATGGTDATAQAPPNPVKKKEQVNEIAPELEPKAQPESGKAGKSPENEADSPPFDPDPPKTDATEEPPPPQKAPRPAPNGDLKGEDLWNAAKSAIDDERPLMSGWTQGAQFLDQNGRNFVIGFSPGNKFARDSMMRDKSRVFVEELLEQLSGTKLSLQCEIRDNIPEPEVPHLDDPPEAEPGPGPRFEEPKPAKKPEKQPERPAEPEPEADSEPEIVEAEPPVDEEKFKNDPLIQEALRLFEAEVETTK